MAVKAGLQLTLGHFYTPNIKNTNFYISKLPPFFLSLTLFVAYHV